MMLEQKKVMTCISYLCIFIQQKQLLNTSTNSREAICTKCIYMFVTFSSVVSLRSPVKHGWAERLSISASVFVNGACITNELMKCYYSYQLPSYCVLPESTNRILLAAASRKLIECAIMHSLSYCHCSHAIFVAWLVSIIQRAPD